MSKHTPGPWHWSDEFNATGGRKTWSLIGDSGYGILSCDGEENSPHSLNDEANARLIAAAPDLLEALMACIEYGAMTGDEWVIEKARAAIAKATGAAP